MTKNSAADVPGSPALSERALAALPGAVIVLDATDTIRTWNPAAEALFEVPVACALARKFRDLDVIHRVDGLRARIEDVKARRASMRMTGVTFTRRNGGLAHADITVSPLIDAHRLVGVLVSATEPIEELQSTNQELATTNEELQSTNEELQSTNEELQSTVSELQATNAELTTLNAELQARTAELRRLDAYHLGLLDSLEYAVFVTDRALVVTSWNRAAERMWGLPAEQAAGRNVLSLPVAQLTPTLRPALEGVLKGAAPSEVREVPCTLPDGTRRTVLVKVAPLHDRSGALVGIVASAAGGQSGAARVL